VCRNRAVLSGGLHPHYGAVTQTIAHAECMRIERLAAAVDAEAAVIVKDVERKLGGRK